MINFLIKKFVPNYKNPELQSVRERCGKLSGVVGILINIILFVSKFIVGIISSSVSVTADAFNNLSDACSSIITFVCFKISGIPADRKHPFGHGRIEYVSGLIISVIIIITGFEFTKSSIEKIFSPEEMTFSFISIAILIGSLILKLWLGLFNKKLCKIINSSAIRAAAADSLIDVVVTSAVIIGMFIYYFTGHSLDAYIGIIVSLFILFTGISSLKGTLDPIIGQASDEELVKNINSLVMSYPNVVGMHDLMIHNYGPGKTFISLHVEMPSDINIIKLHDTVDDIEKDLKSKFNCEATIHLDPLVADNEAIINIREMLKSTAKEISSSASVHDLRIIPSETHGIKLIFDLVISYEESMKNEEIAKQIRKKIRDISPYFNCLVEIKRT